MIRIRYNNNIKCILEFGRVDSGECVGEKPTTKIMT